MLIESLMLALVERKVVPSAERVEAVIEAERRHHPVALPSDDAPGL
ncbi:hypothetical protein LRS73_11755 [Methylobacterium currus]|jgi:hypothetical protein|nr:hypothetical protein [Methylobacterium currus]UHC18451.1 hypothetical protein LRS73_11755 [Methylobacterium currus]